MLYFSRRLCCYYDFAQAQYDMVDVSVESSHFEFGARLRMQVG